MDEDVSKGTVLANPQLYQDGQSNSLFTLYLFVRWVANGVWMSAVVFFVGFGTYTEDVMALDGKSMGLYIMGYAVFTGMVLAVNVRLAQEVKKWDWTLHLSVWGSILVWYIWGAIYSPLWPKLKVPPTRSLALWGRGLTRCFSLATTCFGWRTWRSACHRTGSRHF